MRNLRMYCLVIVIVIVTIILSFSTFSEAYELGNKPPSAVIVGTVYCDTCFQAELSKPTHFIAGALVGVECKGSNPSFQKQLKTNVHGVFRVHLPLSISKHVNKIKNCSVKLIKSSEPYCAIASSATQSSLHLKSKNTKTHIFSAGYFTFKPHDQPNLCNQKPTEKFNSRKFLPLIPNNPSPVIQNPIIPNLPLTPNDPSPVQNPTIPNLPPTGQDFFPPLPTLPRIPPLPQLPPLPTLPSLPLLPLLDKNLVKRKTGNALEKTELPNDEVGEDQALPASPQLPMFSSPPPVLGFQFPPISFRPPPLNFPPNPFQPSPPSVNIPTMPNSNPTPILPPPSPPALSNPLPPFPFQPSRGFPGFPPATSSEKKSP